MVKNLGCNINDEQLAKFQKDIEPIFKKMHDDYNNRSFGEVV